MCELNLWGIETLNYLVKLRSKYFVWIEPVRDWNFAFVFVNFVFVTVWIEPVRDWNNLEDLPLGVLAYVWIEPVRDWNLKQLLNSNGSTPVWIEPVRDWNSQLIRSLPSNELVWIEPVRDWNFTRMAGHPFLFARVNWTCEGLKPFCVITRVMCGWCVNWTCEGLKLGIRNQRHKIDNECELNLWGIETETRTDTLSDLPECELNLWGIETQLNFSSSSSKSVWIEPVRDWNTITFVPNKPKGPVWIEPVRDWNL